MKKTKRLMCLAIVLIFISMIGASMIQTNFGDVDVNQLNIMTDEGWVMSANLYVPSSATAENPAPAVVTSHGHYNNKEMQDANYVELARRGYVVLAIDQPNHGNSDNFYDTNVMNEIFVGVYPAALTLSRYDFVDSSRIGVTGHSAGGNSCNFAVQEDIEKGTNLISAVLLNNSNATFVDADGNYANVYGNVDMGIISAQYDEFMHYEYVDGQERPAHFAPYFMNTDNAQSFLNFGADPTGLEARQADTLYTEEIDGEEAIRVIYRPDIIHPWSHFSAKSTAATVNFFEATLGAPNAIDENNQIWQWKEAFNFVGVVGVCMFIVAFAILMTRTPFFSEIVVAEQAQPAIVSDNKGKVWFWGSLAVNALISTLIYFPLVSWGVRQELLVMQVETLGLGLWSMCCGILSIISMVVYYKCYGKKNGFDLVASGVKQPARKLGKTVLLALLVAGVAYAWVFFADYFFKVDFRLWTLAFKTFNADMLGIAAFPYVWMFLTFYVAASVSINAFNYNNIGGKLNGVIVAVFTAFPALVLPWMQYGYYYATDEILFWGATDRLHMYCLWLFPIVLILLGASWISRAIYKKTKNPYLAGIVLGLIVTIISVINTRNYCVFM